MSENKERFNIDDYLQEENRKYTVSAEDFFAASLAQYDNFDNKAWSKGEGYTCPNFPMFNDKMEGLEAGLYLFAGESNTGKTCLLTNLLWDYCMNETNKLFGVYFSLDDSIEEVIPRIISMNKLIPISVSSKPYRYQKRIDAGEENTSIYQEWLQKRTEGLELLRSVNNKFKIEDGTKITCAEQLLDYCQKLQDYIKGLDEEANMIIGIDSLSDLTFPSQNFRSGDDKSLNDYIAKQVKKWAVEILKVPIFGSVHLRKVDQRRRPNIADVKESGRYVYEASAVFVVHNDVSRNGQCASIYYTEPDSSEMLPIIEIQWAKNKKSSFKGRTYCHFVPNFSKVIECTQEETDRFNNLIYSSK